MQALTPKPSEALTVEEKASIEGFNEYQELKSRLGEGLTPNEEGRYAELSDRLKKGELRSFHSYINPIIFYLVFALVVGL